MTVPDVIIIGPQKAGTTWIHRYLEFRGDICLPNGVKETMFFDKYFARGGEWYGRHFQEEEGDKRTVEVAPSYFHNPMVPKRMHDMLGDIQLVCSLRNPAERSFSLYLHMRRYGMTACTDFREAVEKHPVIIESSQYAIHLERWINVFGRGRMLVLFQQDLAEDASGFAIQLCEYLDIPYIEPDDALRQRVNAAALPASPAMASIGQTIADKLRSGGLYPVVNWAKNLGLKKVFFGHSGGDVPSLCEDDYTWLMEKLQSEMDKLEAMLDINLSQWKHF